jgi:hypothetical protein
MQSAGCGEIHMGATREVWSDAKVGWNLFGGGRVSVSPYYDLTPTLLKILVQQRSFGSGRYRTVTIAIHDYLKHYHAISLQRFHTPGSAHACTDFRFNANPDKPPPVSVQHHKLQAKSGRSQNRFL